MTTPSRDINAKVEKRIAKERAEMKAIMSDLYPEVDWDYITAPRSLEQTRADLLDAGRDPAAVKRYVNTLRRMRRAH
jgi:hypothetical protein